MIAPMVAKTTAGAYKRNFTPLATGGSNRHLAHSSLMRARRNSREPRNALSNTERGFGGKPPQKSGFRRHLAGSKMPKEGSKMPKETFFHGDLPWESGLAARARCLGFLAGVEVAPVSWTPDYLGSRSRRWARQEQPTRLSSAARWLSWCAPAGRRRSWRVSSNRRHRRSGTGWHSVSVTPAGATAA